MQAHLATLEKAGYTAQAVQLSRQRYQASWERTLEWLQASGVLTPYFEQAEEESLQVLNALVARSKAG